MMTATIKMIKKFMSGMIAMAVTAAMTATAFGTASATNEISDAELRSLANEVAILVNEAREEAGLDPIYVLPYLNELSDIRAMETVSEFSHSRNGQRFSSIIDTDVVDYLFAAENLAAGNCSAEETFDQWKNSPGHWRNIMNESTTHMGIGVVYDPDSDYGWYWQQLFIMTDQTFEDQYLPTEYEIVPKTEGDINGDGVVDTYDYLGLCDYIYKKKTDVAVYLNEAQLQTADCFRDGIITEADAKVMMRYLLGEYKTFPFEF